MKPVLKAVLPGILAGVLAAIVWLYASSSGREWRLRRASESSLLATSLAQPGDELAARVLTERLLAGGKPDEAVASLEPSVRARPESEELLVLYARALTEAGRPIEALAALKPRISAKPRASVLAAAGEAYYAIRSLDAAMSHFRRALEFNSEFARAWSGLAFALADTHKLEEARRAADRAVRFDPEDARSHAALAYAIDLSGDGAYAITRYRRALELSARDPFVWELFASAAARSVQSQREALSVAHELESSESHVLRSANIPYFRGLLLMTARDYSRAEQGFRTALKRNPNFTRALYNLSLALRFQGKVEQSRETAARFDRARAYEREVTNLTLRASRETQNRKLWKRVATLAESQGDSARALNARRRLAEPPSNAISP